jgi:hypothetical protein
VVADHDRQPLTGGTLPAFRFANKAAAERNVFIQNIDGFKYLIPTERGRRDRRTAITRV